MHTLFQIDALLANFFSPVMRALIWGAFTGIFGMGAYALVAPQEKIRAIKSLQKANKAQIKAYDGEFDGMRVLLKADLAFSLKLVVISVVPFLLSVTPVVLLLYGLDALYMGTEFPTLGFDWTGSFEFWFCAAAITVSMSIKSLFKIA